MFTELADWRVCALVSLIYLGLVSYALAKVGNGWMYVIPSLLGPLLATAILVLRPLNPYSSIYAQFDKDLNSGPDRGARCRLVAMLSSYAARRRTILSGIATAVLLFSTYAGYAYVARAMLDWSVQVGGLLGGTLLFTALPVIVHVHLLVRWAGQMWARER